MWECVGEINDLGSVCCRVSHIIIIIIIIRCIDVFTAVGDLTSLYSEDTQPGE